MGRLTFLTSVLIFSVATAVVASSEDDPGEAASPLLESPLDLNSASVEELMLIPSVSRRDAELIVDFRSGKGAFSITEELFEVKGLDPAKAADIMPYVRADEEGRYKRPSGRLSTKVSRTFRGADELSPYKTSLRLYGRSGKQVSFGLLTDKDRGERNFADFTAAYVDISGAPFMDRVVLGHYRPGFPMGLMFSRSSWTLSPPRFPRSKHRSPVGYSLLNEDGSLFGLFLEKSFGSFRTSVFASNSARDAKVDSLGTVVALREGGIHVTENELSGKDALSEKAIGANLSWRPSANAFFDISLCSIDFSRELELRYGTGGFTRFSGRKLDSFGLSFGTSTSHLDLFGGMASNSGGSHGAIFGAELDYERVNIYILARTYDPGFMSPYGSGYSVYGDAGNEFGILFDAEFKSDVGEISARFDQYGRFWGKGPSAFPARGSRLSTELRRRISARFWASIRLRLISHSDSFWKEEGDRGELRGEWTWKGDSSSCLRWRIERILARDGSGGTEGGVLTFGDLRVKSGKIFTFGGRISFFDTDSYLSRVYESEGMLATSPFRSWSGRGMRWYIFSVVDLGATSLALRFDRMFRGDRDDLEFILQTDTRF